MSTMDLVKRKCALCGGESSQMVLFSTNCFGSPDLDMRPAPMQRNTMDCWGEMCPHCGYVAHSISSAPTMPLDFFATEEYQNTDGIRFSSSLAKKFYRHHLIFKAEGNLFSAYLHLLYAAWACDDGFDYEDWDNAKLCRLKMIALFDSLPEEKRNDINEQVRFADVLRRAGRFNKVIELYTKFNSDDKLLNKIIAFQLKLAREGDTSCYTVSAVK